MLEGLRQIEPYVAGIQPQGKDIIKLNTNENAYGPSPHVQTVLNTFDANQLTRYSSLDQIGLREALSEKLRVPADQIIIGNGSDDILSMAFLAFFNSDKPILFPEITYGFYKVWADLYHINYHEIPLNDDFEVEASDYISDNGGIIIANPNAPTGIYKSLTDIEAVIKANQDVVVVIDEAYINFGGQSALPLIDKYENVFITRTFSKDAALAGMRVGYGVGSPRLLSVINAVKNSINPYNVDSLAEAVATAAVKDWSYYDETCRKICQTRDWFRDALLELGFKVLPSKTNFILTEPIGVSAPDLFNHLENHRIYVRYFPKIDRLKNKLRISIGTQAEMEAVLSVIKELIG